jgi:TatD DNase family protein
VRGVLHCYTGTLEFAKRAIDHGLCISFSGILTFKKDRGLRDVAGRLPLTQLLVETDCPLLSPEGHRGRRNEPARVAIVGAALAAAQGRSVDDVARVTTQNARTLFRLPEPDADAR